jgi:hypothetical protein
MSCIAAFFLYQMYQMFVSDWLEDKLARWRDSRTAGNSINKIAQVKLVSDDAKGIEKFVSDNAQYLSTQTVQKLVGRIEDIKAGSYIAADDTLRARIEELPKPMTEALPLEEEPAKAKRARR